MKKTINKYVTIYINPFLILLIIVWLIIVISNLYLNNQKSLTNQNYCLDYYKNINIDTAKAIKACNKY